MSFTAGPKPEIEEVRDPTVPTGIRVLHHGEAWQIKSRFAVCELAGAQCEGCKVSHSLPWPEGDAHHRLGRGTGGGWRDDRPLIPMQTIETEPNLARWRWFRNLLWTCRVGHRRQEVLSTAEYRRNLKRFCTCGLLHVWQISLVHQD